MDAAFSIGTRIFWTVPNARDVIQNELWASTTTLKFSPCLTRKTQGIFPSKRWVGVFLRFKYWRRSCLPLCLPNSLSLFHGILLVNLHASHFTLRYAILLPCNILATKSLKHVHPICTQLSITNLLTCATHARESDNKKKQKYEVRVGICNINICPIYSFHWLWWI